MTDIEVLEREKQCVQRKAATNCFDCARCDLLMDDTVILAAYDHAISALRQQECVGEVNKALTMDELSERNAPVFLPIKDFPNGGYWCLCENGYIIPPSGHGFMAKERPNWVFYSRKPEEDDHDERKENENA